MKLTEVLQNLLHIRTQLDAMRADVSDFAYAKAARVLNGIDRGRVMMRLAQFETMIATTIARTNTWRATKSREGMSRRVIRRTGRNANIPRPSKRRRREWRERLDAASRRACQVVRRPGTSLHGGKCIDSPHMRVLIARSISVLAMQLSANSFYSTSRAIESSSACATRAWTPPAATSVGVGDPASTCEDRRWHHWHVQEAGSRHVERSSEGLPGLQTASGLHLCRRVHTSMHDR
jgi:hypothetical protein